jgi:surface antigen
MALVFLMSSGVATTQASFDMDGVRLTATNSNSERLISRETWSSNIIKAAGYGDQCTSYALDRMHDYMGAWLAVRGNAYEWADEARASGWTVGTIPVANSIMVMSPGPGYKFGIRELDGMEYETPMHPLGHVAWVEKLDGDWALIDDQNWTRGRIGSRWVHVKDAPLQFIYAR